jgi:hypothetical protein
VFERLGLGWPEQTEDFLARSQKSSGNYYSVFRDNAGSTDSWRQELDRETVDKIRGIVEHDPLGAQFFAGDRR